MAPAYKWFYLVAFVFVVLAVVTLLVERWRRRPAREVRELVPKSARRSGDATRLEHNAAAYVVAISDPNPSARLDALDYLERRAGAREAGYNARYQRVGPWSTFEAREDARKKATLARLKAERRPPGSLGVETAD